MRRPRATGRRATPAPRAPGGARPRRGHASPVAGSRLPLPRCGHWHSPAPASASAAARPSQMAQALVRERGLSLRWRTAVGGGRTGLRGGAGGCATPLRVFVVPLAFRGTVQVVTFEKAVLLTPSCGDSKGVGRPADAAVLVALQAGCRRERPHRRGGKGELDWLMLPRVALGLPQPIVRTARVQGEMDGRRRRGWKQSGKLVGAGRGRGRASAWQSTGARTESDQGQPALAASFTASLRSAEGPPCSYLGMTSSPPFQAALSLTAATRKCLHHRLPSPTLRFSFFLDLGQPPVHLVAQPVHPDQRWPPMDGATA